MDHLFFGINYPAPRNFERIRVENVNFNDNAVELIEKFRSLTGNKDEVSLVYLGNVLDETEPINRYNLRPGSTIHVLKKSNEDKPKNYKSFSEMDVSSTCAMYRSLNSGNFHKISRPEVSKIIYDAHPELKKDVIAMSFLRDPTLLSNLQNPNTVRKIAQHHRVLIEASNTIVSALKSARSLGETSANVPSQASFEDLSDSSSSSSSSGSENSPGTSGGNGARRNRITPEFLRNSLAVAQNRNSLANISQRNLNQINSTISPSTSSSTVPSTHRFISNSMFMNAMNEVLMANRRANEGQPPAVPTTDDLPPPTATDEERESTPAAAAAEEIFQEDEAMEEDERRAQEERDIEMITLFQPQLRQMEELGLRNKAQNIQALMLCNGNLEAAVNLVLTELNSDMMD